VPSLLATQVSPTAPPPSARDPGRRLAAFHRRDVGCAADCRQKSRMSCRSQNKASLCAATASVMAVACLKPGQGRKWGSLPR